MIGRTFDNARRWIALAAGMAAMLVAGCQQAQTASSEGLSASPAPPDPAERLVVREARLGASDTLGHQLFASESTTRYAGAGMVFRMAAAENPALDVGKLDKYVNDSYSPRPEQAIVSGEKMMRMKGLAEEPDEPATAKVETGPALNP